MYFTLIPTQRQSGVSMLPRSPPVIVCAMFQGYAVLWSAVPHRDEKGLLFYLIWSPAVSYRVQRRKSLYFINGPLNHPVPAERKRMPYVTFLAWRLLIRNGRCWTRRIDFLEIDHRNKRVSFTNVVLKAKPSEDRVPKNRPLFVGNLSNRARYNQAHDDGRPTINFILLLTFLLLG